jgi:hypothetical protein
MTDHRKLFLIGAACIILAVLLTGSILNATQRLNRDNFCDRQVLTALQKRGEARLAGDVAAQERDIAWIPWLDELHEYMAGERDPAEVDKIFTELRVKAVAAIQARELVVHSQAAFPYPDCYHG